MRRRDQAGLPRSCAGQATGELVRGRPTDPFCAYVTATIMHTVVRRKRERLVSCRLLKNGLRDREPQWGSGGRISGFNSRENASAAALGWRLLAHVLANPRLYCGFHFVPV